MLNLNIDTFVYLPLFLIVAYGALTEPLDPYKPNRRLQNFALVIFVLLSGLRFVGDTPGYAIYYQTNIDSPFEIGYVFISNFFRTLHFNFPLFLLSVTAITGLLIKKAFANQWFFFAMLMILGKLATFYAFSGLRQWIALCICFYAVSILLKGKRLYFLLIVIIAVQFHRSAIIIAPMALFYKREFRYKVALITICIAIVIGMNPLQFLQSASDVNPLLDGRGYLTQEGNEVAMGGINAFNWVENFAILIPAVFFRKKIHERVPNYDFFLYMHLIYCAFLIAGSDFGIIKRLRDYYVTGYYVLLPAFMYLFPQKQRRFYLLFVVLYFGLLFFRSLNYYWQVGQYQSVFSHPEAWDMIWGK